MLGWSRRFGGIFFGECGAETSSSAGVDTDSDVSTNDRNGGYFGSIFQVRSMMPKAKSKGQELWNNFLSGGVGGLVVFLTSRAL
jgi:hypothetical protein